MLLGCAALLSTNVYALAVDAGNSFQTGILVMLGSFLFVLGWVFRRTLREPAEKTNRHPLRSHPLTLTRRVEPLPSHVYSGPVAGVVNASRPQRHVSAV
jgi:hypothetical protein